jgi:hypothetical protein
MFTKKTPRRNSDYWWLSNLLLHYLHHLDTKCGCFVNIAFFTAVTVIVAIGLIDDIKNLSYKARFAAEIVVALIMIKWGLIATPILDSFCIMIRRIRKGRSPYSPSCRLWKICDFIHHSIVRCNLGHNWDSWRCSV